MAYDPSNIFARMIQGEIPAHKIYETKDVLCFMDIMPQAKGHALVIPKCQAVELSDMPADKLTAVFSAAQKVIKAQRDVLGVKGVVQMQLNHSEAGQTVFHYHAHLIPTSVHKLGEHGRNQADHAELAELAAKLKAHIDAQD